MFNPWEHDLKMMDAPDDSGIGGGNNGQSEGSSSDFDDNFNDDQSNDDDYSGDEDLDGDNYDSDQGQQSQSQEMFTFKYNGQDVSIPRDKVEQFAQMGYDYTKKTQELAEQRRMYEPLEKLAQIIGSDPQLEQALAQYIYERETGQPFTQENVASYQIERMAQDIARQQETIGIAQTLFTFQQKTGMTIEQLVPVVQLMAEKGFQDPQDAYDLIQFRQNQYNQKKAEPRPKILGKGGSPLQADNKPKAPKSWDDAKKAALDFLTKANKQNNY